MDSLVAARDIHKRFGKVSALEGFDLDLHAGEVVGLIGPNGSGKSTLVKLVSGALRPSSGRILLGGVDATRWSPQRRCHWGLACTQQVARPLPDMTVFDNMLVAALFGGSAPSVGAARCAVRSVLDECGLAEDAASLPRALPVQHVKVLGIARAVVSQPKALLLDETLAGLTSEESGRVVELIRKKRDEGLGILFIEHRLPDVLAVCDRVYVLNTGKLLAHGDPQAVVRDPAVMKAYLGIEAHRRVTTDA